MSSVLIIVLSTIVVVNALLLIGLVLIQQSKGGGFASSAFGGAGDAVFGAHASNQLTRATVFLTASFFVLTLILAIITGQRGAGTSAVENAALKQPAALVTPADAKKEAADKVDAVKKAADKKAE